VSRPHQYVYILHNDSAKCHILECGDPGMRAMNPKFDLGKDFCTVHLPTKFHHPTFNCLEVIVLTNTQTNTQVDTAENIHLALQCYAGGELPSAC